MKVVDSKVKSPWLFCAEWWGSIITGEVDLRTVRNNVTKLCCNHI